MLSQHQALKQDEVINHISRGERVIVLEGSAGTGKTYMVNWLIKKIRQTFKIGGVTYITAPTHKALSILKGKIEVENYIDFCTIHSGLKLKRKFINRKQVYVKPTYINPRFPPFKNGTILFIDESSMIGNKEIADGNTIYPGMLDMIEEYKDQMIIIFLGDRKQLPPVNEQNSPVFHKGYPIVTLTEIQRQKVGNPIIHLSNNISEIWRKQENTIKIVNEPPKPVIATTLFDDIDEPPVHTETKVIGYTYSVDRNRIIDRLAEANGTSVYKYLAYMNNDVDLMNYEVRKKIYGNPKKIELNEILIFTAPYKGYMNNEEIRVNELEISNMYMRIPKAGCIVAEDVNGMLNIRNEVVQIDGELVPTFDSVPVKSYFINKEIAVLHEDAVIQYNNLLAGIKRLINAGDLDYKAETYFEEQLAKLTYGHAITVHKSQGSTYEKVFINIENIMMNRDQNEKRAMLYTAITRASDLVILYNVK